MSSRFRVLVIRTALALATALTLTTAVHAQRPFSFAVIGDTPYFSIEEQGFATLLGELDAEPLAFVVHVGDIKRAGAPCSDALFAARRSLFDASRHPFVFIPGDNEWTDCHASGADPLERLAALRRIFYSRGESLGQHRIALASQSSDPRHTEYRENVRWEYGHVLFVGLNVPGSNNNLGRTAEMDAEHRRRMSAVFDWLDASLKLAERRRLAGVAILFHADPGFDGKAHRPRGAPDGFAELRNVLRASVERLERPVLLAHGDTHAFRLDQPLRNATSGAPLANLTRVEVPGSPAAEAVVVDVDPATSRVFTVHPPAGAAIFPENP
ncbi:MAG: hypothetical protein LJE97_06535 [Betaproteobacteria bacterium]|nr:hypothetical protein [Betaproteobacteria bacterium]